MATLTNYSASSLFSVSLILYHLTDFPGKLCHLSEQNRTEQNRGNELKEEG